MMNVINEDAARFTNTSSSCSQDSQTSDDLIIMTPYNLQPRHTLLNIVRMKRQEWTEELQAKLLFKAEGDHSGIVINKSGDIAELEQQRGYIKSNVCDASLSFKVFLVNAATQHKSMEHRTLRFWFSPSHPKSHLHNSVVRKIDAKERSRASQDYFRSLIGTSHNETFPKNYNEFFIKLMRLLKQDQFKIIHRLECELKPLNEDEKPLSRSSSMDGGSGSSRDGDVEPELTSQKVLELIESSYPQPINIQDLCRLIAPQRIGGVSVPSLSISSQAATNIEQEVKNILDELHERKKITTTDGGLSFSRITLQDRNTKINLVKQMPRVTRAKQPSIAIITAQYCEKVAVDAMISNKDTYVRYKTEGESANYIYTLGNIGNHHVVSTKLPPVNNSREALIAAGNPTTRLLGTFQQLDYIFLIGCGGGVVDYTNFSNHVRLGDIVISSPPNNTCELGRYIYVHGEDLGYNMNNSTTDSTNLNDSTNVEEKKETTNQPSSASIDESGRKRPIKRDLSQLEAVLARQKLLSESQRQPTEQRATAQDKETHDEQYQFKFWCPPSLKLQELAQRMWTDGLKDPQLRIWEQFINDGCEVLKQQEILCTKPTKDGDKLHMSIGSKDVIEVNHPEPEEEDVDLRAQGWPMCHFGPIGSCRMSGKNSDALRQALVDKFSVRAIDSEFDAVIESIHGNRKDSYIFIRGISDYRDGRKKRETQQYASLIAASFMKAMILNLQTTASNESDV